MEVRDQAVELYNRFFNEVPFLQSNDDLRDDMNAAKKCALIASDEIIKELNNFKLKYSIEWWESVKEEIKKI